MTLYLYGPPACGKTTTAMALARRFGRMAVDLDAEIVRRAGRSIPDIFASDGEAAFRRLESETLRSVSAPIVALGGGALLDPANREFAEKNGMVVVLDVDAETIARRIEAAKGTRPLGDMLERRRAHYASFVHHADADTAILLPRLLRGAITPPPSKSHLHRLIVAEFLSSGGIPAPDAHDCADVAATKRCIAALRPGVASPVLDVGESGSTLRFLAPVAAALGFKPSFVRRGRLAERPFIEYDSLKPGVHELRGDVSSQFVTGLLFALPLLDGDSEIRFSTPLQSRGYVDMTLDVVRSYGIRVEETPDGFAVPGRQRFVSPGRVSPEADWSGAAFWFAANALGSEIAVKGTCPASRQPDSVAPALVAKCAAAGSLEEETVVDVSGCPDLYPALAVVAHVKGGGKVRFTGTERLRIKESDRLAAMEAVFANPRDVNPRNDHRIAMAAAVLSTVSGGPTLIHDASCVAKSYPGFWDEFSMDLYAVTGWPLKKTRSPEIHNAAYAKDGRKAEMVSYPAETVDEALRFADVCGVKGMAVTIPHKQAIMDRLDLVDPAAMEIGAVNTVVFRDGRKTGYNTDEAGFAEAFRKFAGRESFTGEKVALLGAGGAAKAVAHALSRLGAEVVVFHRRPLERGFRYIVNATPVDPVPEYEFDGTECVYDLRYVPAVTPLMERAAAAGCRVENGFSMLEAQARLQRRLFFDENF
jgi:3-phosphoshikimate 1-carboxyvinyltransferase